VNIDPSEEAELSVAVHAEEQLKAIMFPASVDTIV
jgi:hypothetical protein